MSAGLGEAGSVTVVQVFGGDWGELFDGLGGGDLLHKLGSLHPVTSITCSRLATTTDKSGP